ncbi:single-strand DNA-binding protein [Treponema bryantii]|uniref:Single-strand DNA-binding protein n=1 Tax=Treponema bryantii TaxID=163 RepID=A0A1H9B0X8_9SPIR|nr:single-stranded DNA-binding protein [Treponema bryantii]SEP82361.1 single-strand DNA-binding protein [Treponema bryantii]
MDQMNSLIIEGNVTREVAFHELGVPSADFEIGVARQYRDRNNQMQTEVSHFEILCYGNMAENVKRNAILNREIRVVGRMKQECWRDSTGKSHSKVVIIAEHIEYKIMKEKNND